MFTQEIVEQNLQTLMRSIERIAGEIFPVQGDKHTLQLVRLELGSHPALYDYELQKSLKLKEQSLTVPVYGTFRLIDNDTKSVIDEQRMILMRIPALTPRGSYLIDGNEYQTVNQLRLRSGTYTRRMQNGEYETQVNTETGYNFRIHLDPKEGIFTLTASLGDGKKSNIYLYPFLKGIGITDAYISRFIGEELLEKNRQKHGGKEAKELHKFVQAFRLRGEKEPPALDKDREAVLAYFQKTRMDGEITKITLGKAFDTVTPEMILMAAQKLLRVMRREVPEDDRDSLEFKKFFSTTDHLVERLEKSKTKIQQSVRRNVDRFRAIKNIISPDDFNKPIKSFFTTSSLASTTEQTNPLTMLGDFTKVTIMGEGGVENERAVSLDMININPSTLGFLDPVHTPESGKIGATLHLTQMAEQVGDTLGTYVINAKTGKVQRITPLQMVTSVVAFPDQYDRKTRTFKNNMVKVMNRKRIDIVPKERVDFVLISPKAMYDTTTNLIPFLPNDQGNRAMMASKMQEQALPLKYRESPLVQSVAEGNVTFERAVGSKNVLVSPYDGEIVSLRPLRIKTEDGIKQIPIYDHFPLADGSFIHHEFRPGITVGTKVRKGQILADSNFTRNGDLALGVNLTVAFMPYKGLTFEDGIVISESASKKLTSEHLYVESFEETPDHVLDKRKFMTFALREATADRMRKLDDQGIVKPGEVLRQGDIIIAALRRNVLTDEEMLKRALRRSLVKEWRSDAVIWEKEVPGKVVDVVRQGRRIKVTIKTEEAAREGDKLVGRHGNKGTIAKIIPDNEMPRTEDGQVIDMIINPHAVPSRMNIGQILETGASLIAEKTGKPFLVDNYDGQNYLEKIKQDLKRLGVQYNKKIIDPNEGELENPVFVGKQYILKLKHQTAKKFSARSIGDYDYDEQPIQGGDESGQALDILTNYALLAHGAKHNLYEMSVIKGQRNDEFWREFQAGGMLPKLKPAFVFDKFIANMQALGIKVHKDEGLGQFQLMAMTDQDVEALSSGKIEDATLITARDLKEERGGLMDPEITGGKVGTRWAHIEFAEPIPNPVFEMPIRVLLGLKAEEFDAILSGRMKLNGKTGGEALKDALSKIDVDKELERLRTAIREGKVSKSKLNDVHRKIRYLNALKSTGRKPSDYVMTKFPILPPRFRPIYELPDGNLRVSDVNELYQHLVLMNRSLKEDKKSPFLDEKELGAVRKELYKALQAVQGLSSPITWDARQRGRRGIIEQIGGSTEEAGPSKGIQPKDAFFQRKVVRRRQDLSGRAVIAVGPELDVDEIGLPKEMAWKVFEMHLIRQLVTTHGLSVLEARRAVETRSPLAERVLQKIADETPVLLNRDPSLHKFSIMAFKPRLIDGKTIKLPSLVTSGFNADFDGDSMAVYVPVTEKAKQEALEKMLPSKNLFRPGHGNFMLTPGHEQVLGIWLLTKNPDPNRPVQGVFQNEQQALKAYEEYRRQRARGQAKDKDWRMDDPIIVAGKKVTLGKIKVNMILPPKYRSYDKQFGKGDLRNLFKQMYDDKVPERTIVNIANELKNLGNDYAYRRGFTVSLDDLTINTKVRDEIFAKAEKELKKTPGRPEDIERVFTKAIKELEQKIVEQHPNNAFVQMDVSGARGGRQNLRQILGAPGLLVDNKGRIVETPVKKSYAEGLDTADYWVSMYGARKGMIDRAKSTEIPGAFTKELINNTLDHLITERDCHTQKGLVKNLFLDKDVRFVTHRNLAEDVRSPRNGQILGRRNEVITPAMVRLFKEHGVQQIKVRSPLTCTSRDGLCAKCFGVMPDGREPAIGENIGIITSHALTEPSTQMTMNTFHTGGVASTDRGTFKAEGIDRLKQILEMPKTLPGEATLSTVDGTVTSITQSATGGWNVVVGGVEHFVSGERNLTVKVGDKVQKGDRLSDGVIKPQTLLQLKGIDAVRQYLTEELSEVYGHSIHHNALETVVQKVTNLTKIIDPGKSKEFVEGQYAPLNKVEALNAQGAGIKHQPELRGITSLPLFASEDWIAKMNFQKIKQNILESAAMAARSKYRNTTNPIPAFVYGVDFGKTPGRY